jgi:pimeloyl-ACP methyl ester carboxylesterase
MDAATPAKTAAVSTALRREPNGLAWREVGRGQPLLLLHGLMVAGEMFDPLVERLQDSFRMLIPDLRGHGDSGDLGGPYDSATMAQDVLRVMDEAGFSHGLVLGYSHGGTVAQELARARPQAVDGLFLTCTYACNIMTLRERIEGLVLLAVHTVVTPRMLAGVIVRQGPALSGMTDDQVKWLRGLIGRNGRRQMRGAVRDGLLGFDSRPWLKTIAAPTLVIGGSGDRAVPRHHFDMLVSSIPGAHGREIDGAGHALMWSHTDQLANIIRNQAAAWSSAGAGA